jgi:hypothetical protein
MAIIPVRRLHEVDIPVPILYGSKRRQRASAGIRLFGRGVGEQRGGDCRPVVGVSGVTFG